MRTQQEFVSFIENIMLWTFKGEIPVNENFVSYHSYENNDIRTFNEYMLDISLLLYDFFNENEFKTHELFTKDFTYGNIDVEGREQFLNSIDEMIVDATKLKEEEAFIVDSDTNTEYFDTNSEHLMDIYHQSNYDYVNENLEYDVNIEFLLKYESVIKILLKMFKKIFPVDSHMILYYFLIPFLSDGTLFTFS